MPNISFASEADRPASERPFKRRSGKKVAVIEKQRSVGGICIDTGKPRAIDSDDATIMTSDTVLGLKQLPRTMVVVGAGVIGIE